MKPLFVQPKDKSFHLALALFSNIAAEQDLCCGLVARHVSAVKP